jgi:putative peptidoglycan lipid II flippase
MMRRLRGTGDLAVQEAGQGTPDVGGSARASMVVAGFTGLSRISGVVRMLAIGAVLGPTHLGDAYQVTNTLPNLIWYGFLAGSLVPAMLVPVLVGELERRAGERIGAVSRGFLGVAAVAAAVLVPLAMLGLPLLLRVATLGIPTDVSEQQIHLARVLVLLTAPQTFLYALIGTAGAVMYTHRRFAIPSVGPTVENLGVILVLGAAGLAFGRSDATGTAPLAELVLLGVGSTLAVGLNAGMQCWGAARCGVRLVPTWGWRDEEVRAVLRRAYHALVSAALLAGQTLLVLLLASRVAGGAVALQVAFSFYVLPVALIGTPIGLALLPELSRLVNTGRTRQYAEALARGLASATFLAAPASVGYLLLAGPVADVVAVGQMRSYDGRLMISASLAALSVGLVGQVACFVTTQASYARRDSRTPLRAMVVQALVCLVLCGGAVVIWDGPALVKAVSAAYAVASLAGALLLLLMVARKGEDLLPRLASAGARILVGCAVMGLAVAAIAALLERLVPGRAGSAAAIGVGSIAGILLYVVVARLLVSPELAWWVAGLRRSTPAVGAEEERSA